MSAFVDISRETLLVCEWLWCEHRWSQSRETRTLFSRLHQRQSGRRQRRRPIVHTNSGEN